MNGGDLASEDSLKGILICPLNSGYIEFAYSPGDLVSDLKDKIREVWGSPRVIRLSDYMGKNSWAVFSKCKDGLYSLLIDSDPIPVEPPNQSVALDETHADWAKQVIRDILRRELGSEYSADFDSVILEGAQLEFVRKRRLEKASSKAEVEGSISYEEILHGDYRKLSIVRRPYFPNSERYSVELLALVAVVGG